MGSTGVIWTARRFFSLSLSSSSFYELEYLSDGDM